MSTADRPAGHATAASDVAAACRDAGFVRLVAAADGDALAATGVLARALAATDRPFQASVAAAPAEAERATDADLTVAVGRADPTADCALASGDGNTPVSETAWTAARELGHDGDPILALAGATVGDGTPSGDLSEATREAGAERRPGVGVPTEDVADGLAHSTLVHGPISETEVARTALEERGLTGGLDEEDRRRVASLVAVETVAAEGATPRAAEVVERFLRPHVGGPFETVEGYGDVLDAVARERPGTGIALALGHDAREAALDAWRRHGELSHAAVRTATTGRYDGLFVVRIDAADLPAEGATVPVGTVARLLRDFRSPEPVALAVTDGHAAATAADDRDLATAMERAASDVGGAAGATGRGARATFEVDTAEFIMAFREAL